MRQPNTTLLSKYLWESKLAHCCSVTEWNTSTNGDKYTVMFLYSTSPGFSKASDIVLVWTNLLLTSVYQPDVIYFCPNITNCSNINNVTISAILLNLHKRNKATIC